MAATSDDRRTPSRAFVLCAASTVSSLGGLQASGMTADQFDLFALPKPALALVLGALSSEER